jgi:Mn2+/Fe2+ NRAMP family transporter
MASPEVRLPALLPPRTLERLRNLALVLGPGLVVMLADTDAGSVITVAQSGAQWGYRLLLLQFALIPVLFVAQEMTVRLALGTGKGFGELVLAHFGRAAAWLAMGTLVISCFGALVTQMSGLAGVGELFGVPVWASVGVVAAGVFAMVLSGSYRSVERVAIALGAFELAFVYVAWTAHPEPAQVAAQLGQLPWRDHDYLYLVAANLGTSIMPWTLFYQQSALIDKGIGASQLRHARLDTLFGAVFCQFISAAILVAAAAAFGSHGARALDSVAEIAGAFTPVLGPVAGRLVFALALSGSALVATIVVSLAAAWALGEVSGKRHSLADHPREAPWFYATFGGMLLLAAALVASGVNLVRLAIATGVVNALLLPVALGLLFWLAHTQLPPALRLRGTYAWSAALLLGACAALGLFAGIAGSLG